MQLAFVAVCLILVAGFSTTWTKRHVKLLSMRNRATLRRMGVGREDRKPKVCFDLVGCFADPTARLSLKRPPEHPNVIQTRFLLYTREDRNSPESVKYDDGSQSIVHSRFDAGRALKIIIHGFKGSGSDVGSLLLVQTLLDLEDANVLVLDWTRGAATTYPAAVANTELVGRQLGLILLDAISLGVDPKNIHVIGFSLGAHVAGCASEVLKKKDHLLGRITGLDPASPFFRHHLFREKSRKLDASDARLVDVIHTDGSEDFADGFGLLRPLGHIDFFPNGGREQPGCSDVKNSVFVSHLKEDVLTRDLACSHLRAWRLFHESMKRQNDSCRFDAWPCPQGGLSYFRGQCFPREQTQRSQEMGYAAHRGPLGTYYLATRDQEPFCGQPLRASITTPEGAQKTTGILWMKLLLEDSTTIFRIQCSLPKRKNDMTTFYNIAAAKYKSLSSNFTIVNAAVWYQSVANGTEESAGRAADTFYLNTLAVEDRAGNRWECCSPNIAVNSLERVVELRSDRCPFP